MARCRQYSTHFQLASLPSTAEIKPNIMIDEFNNPTPGLYLLVNDNDNDIDFEPSDSLLQECMQLMTAELNAESAPSTNKTNNNTLYANNDLNSPLLYNINNSNILNMHNSQISMEESKSNVMLYNSKHIPSLYAAGVAAKYIIHPQLPKSSPFLRDLSRQIFPPYIDDKIIKDTNWMLIKQNRPIQKDLNTPQISMELDEHLWINIVTHSLKHDDLPIIPIAVNKYDQYLVEWVKIIRVESQSIYIGVRFKYEVDEILAAVYCYGEREGNISYPILDIIIDYCKELVVSAIQLDLDYINAHRLITSTSHNDFELSKYRPWITDLNFEYK